MIAFASVSTWALSHSSPCPMFSRQRGRCFRRNGRHNHSNTPENRIVFQKRLPVYACTSTSDDVNEGSESTSSSQAPTLLTCPEVADTLPGVLRGTQLDGHEIGLLFAASRDGWDRDVFFEKNALFPGGLPTLVLGKTEDGRIFGAYNAVGFDRRDDFRDSANCFLFTFPKDCNVVISRPTTPQGLSAVFDFDDCAVKMGSADLVIPMNSEKYLIQSNQARSNLGNSYSILENGEVTLFGTSTLSTLEDLETYVRQDFIDEAREMASRDRGSFRTFISGLTQGIFNRG